MYGDVSRRAVLRRFAGAAAATGVAGCSGGDGTVTGTRTTTAGRGTGTGTTTSTATPTETPTATPTLTEASLERQLAVAREVTTQYAGPDGVKRALADGFEPAGPSRNNWTLVRPPLPETVDLRNPPTVMYVREGGELRLGAIGYGVPYDESGPPDAFNDEDADVEIPESEGWLSARGTVYAAFSNGDDVVDDVADLPVETLFDASNWTWTPENPGSPGDEFDVDGDGDPELLDHVFERPPVHALHVWVHLDNDCGVFDFLYEDGTCGLPE